MLRSLALLIIGTILVSCIVTPPLFLAITGYWPTFDYPYSRVFNRVILLVFVLGAILFRRQLSLKQLAPYFKKSTWSFNLKLVLVGIGLALLGSAVGLLLLVHFGKLAWEPVTVSTLLAKGGKALLTGLVVGVLEESIFRILLFIGLAVRFNVGVGAVVSSLLYAVAHFVSPDKSFVFTEYSFGIGFQYMEAVIARLFLPGVLSGIAGLFLVGLVLCYVVHRTGMVYLAIGLHCGWIMAVKLTDVVTSVLQQDLILPGTGTRFLLVSQPIGWLSVVIVWSAVILVLNYGKLLRDSRPA